MNGDYVAMASALLISLALVLTGLVIARKDKASNNLK